MSRRSLALGAFACFALGLGAARVLGTGSPPRPPPAVPVEPRIVFDPTSIDLLPDASLHLDLPPGFDAGGERSANGGSR